MYSDSSYLSSCVVEKPVELNEFLSLSQNIKNESNQSDVYRDFISFYVLFIYTSDIQSSKSDEILSQLLCKIIKLSFTCDTDSTDWITGSDS